MEMEIRRRPWRYESDVDGDVKMRRRGDVKMSATSTNEGRTFIGESVSR